MPHLALPVLTSFLRSHGVDVIQRDLNLETYDAVLSRAYLEQAVDRLRADYAREQRRSARHAPKECDGRWRKAPAGGAGRSGQSRVSQSCVLRWAERVWRRLGSSCNRSNWLRLPFYPAQLDLLNYVPASPVDSSRSLLQAVRDPRHNMFLDIFQRVHRARHCARTARHRRHLDSDDGANAGGDDAGASDQAGGLALSHHVGGPHITHVARANPASARAVRA